MTILARLGGVTVSASELEASGPLELLADVTVRVAFPDATAVSRAEEPKESPTAIVAIRELILQLKED